MCDQRRLGLLGVGHYLPGQEIRLGKLRQAYLMQSSCVNGPKSPESWLPASLGVITDFEDTDAGIWIRGGSRQIPYFLAGPLSLTVCNPGQSHPELVLSSPAYQPLVSLSSSFIF